LVQDRSRAITQSMHVASPKDMMEEARERMINLMIQEAVLCLEAKLVEDAEMLDLAMVLGIGWAPHRGGPLAYAREKGYAAIVESLKTLATKHGNRFQPCAELLRLSSS